MKRRENMDIWEKGRNANFTLVIFIAIFGILMLVCNILFCNLSSSANSQNRSDVVNWDSVFKRQTENLSNLYLQKDAAQTETGNLRKRIDSLELALNTMKTMFYEIEKQTQTRQDDIRQETNNMINKFNGYISWWLFLMGVVCGFAPLILAYLNHKNDSEYIKLLSSNYKETLDQLKNKEKSLEKSLKEIESQSKKLAEEERKRMEKFEIIKKSINLMHVFVYTATFTRKSKFQTLPDRQDRANRLLYEMVITGLECVIPKRIEAIGDATERFAISNWLKSTKESLELLKPYLKAPVMLRKLNRFSKTLTEVDDILSSGKNLSDKNKSLEKLRSELADLEEAYDRYVIRNDDRKNS